MKKGDLYIGLAIILVMALLGAGYKLYTSHLGANRYVNVYINNKLEKSVQLTPGLDMEFTVLTDDNGNFIRIDGGVSTDTGYHYNVIHIYNNGFRVIEADCPNQDDVRQGFVSMPGIDVICLPHHMQVDISGKSSSGLDGLS